MIRYIVALLTALVSCTPAMAYDEALAANARFFATFAE